MFERKGLQTATLLTDTFRRPGDAMARVQGFTDFRYAVMTHPISSLDPEQIRARAREALPEVLSILGLEEDGLDGHAEQPVGAVDGYPRA
jgi:hypothetical protein